MHSMVNQQAGPGSSGVTSPSFIEGARPKKSLRERVRPSRAGTTLLLFFAALIARLYAVGTNPPVPYYDETTGLYESFLIIHQVSNPTAWAILHNPNLTPPTLLYTVIANAIQGSAWFAAIPLPGLVLLRLPVVIYGALSVALVFCLSASIFGRQTGVIAGVAAIFAPWMFAFSRIQVSTGAAEFWPLLSVFLMYRWIETQDDKLFVFSVISGTVSIYTLMSDGAVFLLLLIPLWLLSIYVAGRTYTHGVSDNRSQKGGLIYAIAAAFHRGSSSSRTQKALRIGRLRLRVMGLSAVASAVAAAPFVLYLTQPSLANVTTGGSLSHQFIWSYCPTVHCLASSFAYRAGLAWSPDFLALTGGLSGAPISGSVRMAASGVWLWGGGYTGMLTDLGLLIYPALLLPILAPVSPKRNGLFAAGLAIFVSLTYTAVSGIIEFNVPYAALTAFAAPFFLIFIASFLIRSLEFVFRWGSHRLYSRGSSRRSDDEQCTPFSPSKRRKRTGYSMETTVVLTVALLTVVAAEVPYAVSYYSNNSGMIYREYDIAAIAEVNSVLSQYSLWGYPMTVLAGSNLTYSAPGELSFFDPIKPIDYPIVALNSSVYGAQGLIRSYPMGSVLISFFGNVSPDLSKAGFAFQEMSGRSGTFVYRIFGNDSSAITLQSASDWSRSPDYVFNPGELNWSVVTTPQNSTLRLTSSPAGLVIKTSLPATPSQRGGFWLIGARLPYSVTLARANFMLTDWSFSHIESNETLALNVFASLNNTTVQLPILVFPSTGINLAPVSSYVEQHALVNQLEIGATIQPGDVESVLASHISIFGVLPAAGGSCPSGRALSNGSEFDFAMPVNGTLQYYDSRSNLSVTFCAHGSTVIPLDRTFVQIAYTPTSAVSNVTVSMPDPGTQDTWVQTYGGANQLRVIYVQVSALPVWPLRVLVGFLSTQGPVNVVSISLMVFE